MASAWRCSPRGSLEVGGERERARTGSWPLHDERRSWRAIAADAMSFGFASIAAIGVSDASMGRRAT